MAVDGQDDAGSGPVGAGEWLELGSPRPVRSRRRIRAILIGVSTVLIMALVITGVVLVRPYWAARHERLDRAQVRSVLAGLDLVERSLNWVVLDLRPDERGRCAVLAGPEAADRAGGIPGVQVTGRWPDDEAQLTVLALIFDTPADAERTYLRIEDALADRLCHRTRRAGLLAVDEPPQPDRQLGYRIAVPEGAGGSSGVTWWYRVRILRYGNTLSYVSAFGPTGAADIAAEQAESLDQVYAAI